MLHCAIQAHRMKVVSTAILPHPARIIRLAKEVQ